MQTVAHEAGIEDEVDDAARVASAGVERKELVDVPEDTPGIIGTLIGRITDDLKALGRDELTLARVELDQKLKATLLDTSVILLSGAIASFALAFVMFAGIDAVEPIIHPLWARLLIGAAIYTVLCAGLLVGYSRKLRRDISPAPPRATKQAKKTAAAVKEEIRHA